MAGMPHPQLQAGGGGVYYSRRKKREGLHYPSKAEYEQQAERSDNSPEDRQMATAEAEAEKALHHEVAGRAGGDEDDEGGEKQMFDYHLGSGGHLHELAEEVQHQQDKEGEEEDEDVSAANPFIDYRPSQLSMGTPHPDPIVETSALSAVQLPEHQQEEEGEEEDEDIAVANPFIDYRPSQLSIGTPHPDPVVETAALSAVRLPEPTYLLAIADKIKESQALSCLQLETLVYASQRHLQLLPNGSRAGFFLGDGAGVGKGRTIAGLIWENWLQGRRRALWLSVGSDLRFDARRDLDDVGASCVPLNALNKMSYTNLDSAKMGVKEGTLFLTYNSLIAKSVAAKRTRFQQLEEWCGKDFDGLIVFDECHKAKNLVADGSKKASTQTGRAVRDLQECLPLARVLYCSATGASEPRNMAYMVRLGLWGLGTSFPSFEEFLQGLERGGVGALELVAMEMKARGMYLCRTLSFKGAEFENVEVDLDPEMKERYAKMTVLWEKLRLQFAEALELCSGIEESLPANTAKDEGKGKRKKNEAASVWRMFWASHQRFFRYVCMAAKVPTLVDLVKQVVQGGKCAVIGLQSTGEASTEEVIQKAGTEELEDFVSGPKELLLKLVENYFPAPGKEKTPNAKKEKKESTAKAKNSGRSPVPSKRKRVNMLSPKRKGGKLANVQGNRKRGKNDSCLVAESGMDVSNSIVTSRSGRILRKPQRLHVKEMIDDYESDDDCQDGNSSEYAATDNSSNSREDTDCEEILKDVYEEIGQDGNDIRIISTDDDHQVELPSSNATTHAPSGNLAKLLHKRAELLAEIQALDLPKNPLDTLIDQLGGPNSVAEMTGRKGLLVRSADKKTVVYRSRGSEEDVTMDMVNMHEKQQFMEGKKLVAIISEAASVGISLQADKRAPNQRRRVHITLELPWSADKAIQQFGRTHRSNQTSAPEYKLLFTSLGGERRFASVVAKRLESLGALTQGDRRAGPSLSAYNYDSAHGKKALAKLYDKIMGKTSHDLPVLCREDTMPPPPHVSMKVDPAQLHNHAREALRSVGIVRSTTSIKKQKWRRWTSTTSNEAIADADRHDVGRFLNRLLGLDPDTQNFIFGWFEKIMDKIVKLARMTGDYDSGTKYIKGAHIDVAHEPRTVCVDAESGAETKLHVLNIDRGLTWEAAKQLLKESCEGRAWLTQTFNGFYQGKGQRSAYPILAIERPGSFPPRFRIYYPHSGGGDSLRLLPLDTLKEAFKKLEHPQAAMEAWTGSYNLSCQQGITIVQKRILSGFILPLWNSVENALKQERFLKDRILRIVRAETTSFGDKKQRLIGVELPPSAASRLLRDLVRY